VDPLGHDPGTQGFSLLSLPTEL